MLLVNNDWAPTIYKPRTLTGYGKLQNDTWSWPLRTLGSSRGEQISGGKHVLNTQKM